MIRYARYGGLAVVFLWFMLGGISHFTSVDFFLAVTPANVHMRLHPELYPNVAPAMLAGRLVLQVLLLALIWWSTRVARPIPQPAGA